MEVIVLRRLFKKPGQVLHGELMFWNWNIILFRHWRTVLVSEVLHAPLPPKGK
jgi:hypothetical protein